MENTSERKRKSKGSLSVLDEFTGDAGAISFTPNISKDIQQKIDEKTLRADAPAFAKPTLPSVDKSENYGKPTDYSTENGRKTYGNKKEEAPYKPTENLRVDTSPQNLRKPKPTDTPTDVGRKMDGKPTEISSLVGFQRQAFFSLAQQAKEFGFSDDAGRRITPPINGNVFAQRVLQKPYKQAKDVLYELKVGGFLMVYKVKNGRGGFVQFVIQKSHYQEFLLGEGLGKPTENRLETYGKPTDKPTDTPTEAVSSSSRDLNLKESTTTHTVSELSKIDVGPVQHLGITTSVLARCVELYPLLKPEQLEVLVLRFAEFTKDPKNKVQNARGFFISLAEQASKGQVPLDHIETPDERLMRLFIQRQEQAKSARVNYEEQVLNFECEAWLESLDHEAKLRLVPESSFLKAGTVGHTAVLKRYFSDHIWPERRQAVLESESAVVDQNLPSA